MAKLLPKIVLSLIGWGIFGYVLIQVPYPDTISQATPIQLLYFFLTLFLSITFTLNIFLEFIYLSASIAVGIILLLVLRAMESLNIVTTIMVLIAVGLLFSYFRKMKNKKLTLSSKIPKLTNMRKHNSSS